MNKFTEWLNAEIEKADKEHARYFKLNDSINATMCNIKYRILIDVLKNYNEMK